MLPFARTRPCGNNVRMRSPSGLAVIVAAACASACADWAAIDGGDRALSLGATNDGTVLRPLALPPSGDGYWIPPLWRARGHEYGTDAAIDLIVGVARRIAAAAPPGSPRLGVGDLSPLTGGSSTEHHSHQAGRDVDLLYFITTEKGETVENDAMRRFGGDGVTLLDRADPSAPRFRFDVARNWALVRALITAPEARVQWIFLYEPLSLSLLAYAHDHGESDAILARARAVLHQPGDSAPHDDHMHVRIYCSDAERAAGCLDRGPPLDDDARALSVDDAAPILTDALHRLPADALTGR
jgi:penicillin-insensitive murein endopeptidase